MFGKDKKNQRDLFESERNFRLLVEGVADYALYMLDPAGIITSWNIGGERIKGYSPREILGQHFSRFYTETDRANGKPARALRIAREKGRYEDEGWRVRKDGTFFWASVVIDPIYEDGRLVGFAKITRDVTERREAQLKLEEMQKQLAEAQKLDALGQLTGGVAHDFNNLLMIISGSIHTLKKGVGNTVRLEFDLPHTALPVSVDPTEFETALVNLVINARDAMPGGGTITVSARAHDGDEETSGQDYIAITVKDT